MRELGGLWCEVLESIYGGWRGLETREVSKTSSIWWRDLIKSWEDQMNLNGLTLW